MLDAVTGPVACEPPVSCVIGAWLVKARYPVRVVAAELIAMAEHGLLTIKAGAEGYTLRMVAVAGLGATVYSIVRGYAWGVETGIGTGLLGSWWIKRPVPRSRRARAVTRRLEQLRLVLRAEADPFRDPGPVPSAWHFPWAIVLLPDPVMGWWIQRTSAIR